MDLKKLKKDLQSEDVTKRHSAAIALANGDERAIYLLFKALYDKSPAVQDAAMYSLIHIGGEMVAYMCLPLLRQGVTQKNLAVMIMGELGDVCEGFLYDMLDDCDKDIRIFALGLLGNLKTIVDTKKIVALLEDDNPNVRVQVVKTIGKLDIKDSHIYLERALEDNEEWVSFAALEALSKTHAVSAVKAISEIAEKGSNVLRYQAMETLGEMPSKESKDAVVSFMEGFTEEGDTFIRSMAVKSLIKLGVEPHMSFISGDLMEMLDNGSLDDKLLAIKGIKELSYKSALANMVDLAGSLDLTYPENEEIYSFIIEAIGEVGDCESFVEILNHNNWLKFRGKTLLIELIGLFNCVKGVDSLITMLNDPVRDIRRSTARSLGKLAHRKSIPHLINTLNDDECHVKRQVAYALRMLKADEAFTPLINLISVEKCSDVLEEAVRALIAIDKDRFLNDVNNYREDIREIVANINDDIDVILKLVDDDSENVRISAISRLGTLDDPRAEGFLIEVFNNPRSELRTVALVGLMKIGRFSEVFLTALHDTNMWVRYYAVKAIWETGGEDFIGHIVEALKDPEPSVVLGAIEALISSGSAIVYNALSCLKEHENELVRCRVKEVLELL